MAKTTTKTNQIKPQTVSIDDISRDFTDEDWQMVAREKKYYKLVTSLRKRRKEIGLTQNQLAMKANLPRATIVRVESGTRNATLDTLMQMANSLGREVVISLQ